jgi:hypothetical protein
MLLILDLPTPPPPPPFVRDHSPPVITLLGAAAVTVLQRAHYADAGATAFSAADGFVPTLVHTTLPRSFQNVLYTGSAFELHACGSAHTGPHGEGNLG